MTEFPMPTTPHKPTAKSRQRARKADQHGGQKDEKVARLRPDQADRNPMADVAIPAEVESGAADAALSGEILPLDIRPYAAAQFSDAIGFHTIMDTYAECARTSWQIGRALVDRLMTAHSFEETVELQGDFAKQAYANFAAHSQKICELYAEFTRQFFQPLEKLATEWTMVRRS
jgi:Phasin protein